MKGSSRSPLWHYHLDTGVWTEIQLQSPYPGPYSTGVGTGGEGGVLVTRPQWAPDADRNWVVMRHGDSSAGVTSATSWWRGVGTTAGAPSTRFDSTIPLAVSWTAGLAGDIVSSEWFTDNHLIYIPTGSSTPVRVGVELEELSQGKSYLALLNPGVDRSLIMNSASNMMVTPDYRTTTPEIVIFDVGVLPVSAQHGVYIGRRPGGAEGGVNKLTDLFGTPGESIVAASGLPVGWIRVDNQARLTVAAIVDGTDLVGTLDGTAWEDIPGPGADAADLSEVFEVVRR
jgi:hypothetical protein